MSGGLFWEILGWVALALNVWGNVRLTSKGKSGWIIRLLCNLCWIAYSLDQRAWALLANHAVFIPINLWGFWKWRESQSRRFQRDDCTADAKCRTCKKFRCSQCKLMRPACMGAGDEHLDWCDDCWYERHSRKIPCECGERVILPEHQTRGYSRKRVQ